MQRFKIQWLRSGHIHQASYATTVKGAVRVARKKGFTEHEGHPFDTRPDRAEVYERVDNDNGGWRWELVATIRGNNITTEDNQGRLSYKIADKKMREAVSYMEATHATMMAFNRIADKEYEKELKAKERTR